MLTLLTFALLAAAQPAPPPVLPNAAGFRLPPPTAPMRADPRTEAELRALEKGWGEAFVTRDFAFLERILAPEFRLISTGTDGVTSVTSRPDWMRNSRAMIHLGFNYEVIDVATAGDTATVTLRSSWARKVFADRPTATTFGIVTDTWARRGGKWQVVTRYSQRLPEAIVKIRSADPAASPRP